MLEPFFRRKTCYVFYANNVKTGVCLCVSVCVYVREREKAPSIIMHAHLQIKFKIWKLNDQTILSIFLHVEPLLLMFSYLLHFFACGATPSNGSPNVQLSTIFSDHLWCHKPRSLPWIPHGGWHLRISDLSLRSGSIYVTEMGSSW